MDQINKDSPPPLAKSAVEKAADYFRTPNGQQRLRLLKEETVRNMLEQIYDSRSVSVKVTRTKNILKLHWTFKSVIKDPLAHTVAGHAYIIDYTPEPEKLTGGAIECAPNGSGAIELKLKDGEYYCFTFVFQGPELGIEAISFVAGIPQSNNPESSIKNEMREFVSLRAASRESLDDAIARIKAQNLSPEEEAREIEDLKDYANFLREKHGD